MKKFFLLIVLTFFSFTEEKFSFPDEFQSESSSNNLSSDEIEINLLKLEPFIAISLGERCSPALHLREHNIRIRSFPFDWNVTPFNALYNLIKNNFSGLLDLQNLKINQDENTIYNIKHGNRFNHDFNISEWEEIGNQTLPKTYSALEKYKKTLAYYDRRIKRFNDVLKTSIPIYFFRTNLTSSQAISLESLLKELYPNAKFTLVCIGNPSEESEANWTNLENILHVKMEDPDSCAQHIKDAWKSILLNLKLIN